MTSGRRLLILVALAAALWAGRDALMERTTPRARPKASGLAVAGPAARADVTAIEGAVCITPSRMRQRGLLVASAEADPFSLAPPEPVRPPPVQRAQPVAAAASQPPAPPPEPQLPYRYYGTAKERGLPPSVFLALGNTLIQAKAGDVLEGGYRLESIAPHELLFVNLKLNQTLRLGVDGESAWP